MIEHEINLSGINPTEYKEILEHFDSSMDSAKALLSVLPVGNQFLVCICGIALYNQFRKAKMLGHYKELYEYDNDPEVQSKLKEASMSGIYRGNIGVIYDKDMPDNLGHLVNPEGPLPKTIKIKLIRYGNKDI